LSEFDLRMAGSLLDEWIYRRMRCYAGLGLLGVLLGASCTTERRESPAKLPPASVDSAQRAKAEHLIAALAAGAPEAAERDFSARLRGELPPAVLGSTWHSLAARSGAFQSFRLITSDHRFAKDRFSFQLDFAQKSLLGLVVLEPRSGEIVGLLFSAGKPPSPAPPLANDDPLVEESTLTVGAVPSSALGASLTLPQARGEQRLPGVVLVPGSGPQDRDETLQRAKPFRDLAYGLAHHGVAALRFDKRTYAHLDSFDVKHSTVEEEELADAVSAVRLLAARPEIDKRRIFVVGHSLGGLLAPEIAERASGVAGLVLLAAPGRPVPDITLEQLRQRGAQASDLALLEAKVRALASLPPSETLFGVPVHYFQDLAQRDEMARAVRLRLPVLYLRGEFDQNVAAIDQSIWARALSGQVAFSQATLPGLNHLFLPVENDPSSETHVPDDVSARIAAFTLR